MISIRRTAPVAMIFALSVLGWACKQSDSLASDTAHAILTNAAGVEVGRAEFSETDTGVQIDLAVENLSPGTYQLQIHETGICESPDFLSAGAPYPAPEELAMVENVAQPLRRSVAQFQVRDSSAEVTAVAPVVTLRTGNNSLFHPGGTALIIDDLSPAGTYEGRVACGVITRSSQHAVEGLPPGDIESARHADQVGIPGKEYQQPKTNPE